MVFFTVARVSDYSVCIMLIPGFEGPPCVKIISASFNPKPSNLTN